MIWLGGYISGGTQEGMAAAVCRAVKTLTDGKLAPVAVDPKLPLYPFAPEQLIYISPQAQNYVACWGLTEPCMHHVMKQSRFSGIVLHTLEEEYTDGAGSWFYQVWDAGQMTEWFVSHPDVYFHHWSTGNIKEVVLPLARRAGIRLSDLSVASLVSSRLFSGSKEILRFVRTGIAEQAILNWLSMPAAKAVDHVPEILAIPFAGSVYSTESLSIYADMVNGHIRPEQESDAAMDYYLRHFRRVKAIGNIAETLRPVAFRWSIEPLERDLKYYRFFTWAV